MNVIIDGRQHIDIADCPRCSGSHGSIEISEFQKASVTYNASGKRMTINAWATCPATSEPIVMALDSRPAAIVCTRRSIGPNG